MELEKQYEVEITGISHQGYGVGRIGELVVFVPQAMLEELVLIKIIAIKKKMAMGKLIEVLQPNPHRQPPACMQSGQCGGCELQHGSYAYQLAAKRKIVQDAMCKLARLDIEVKPVLGMKEPWRYRNKGVFHADYSQGIVRLGFYQPESHSFVPANQCLLFSQAVNGLVCWLESAIQNTGLANEIDKIMIRESSTSGACMVVFVTHAHKWRFSNFVEQLQREQPQVVSIYHNVNTNPKVMLGRHFQLLAGEDTILDTLDGLQFQISPQSFFQVNCLQAEVLYRKALEYAALTGTETVIDAYCGIGTISLYFARHAAQVIGVESIAQATKDAKRNAQENHITNCKFITAKTEDWLPKWLAQKNTADLIIVDPPRKGCDTAVLDAIIQSKIAKVIYISCNPSTLARDVKYLTQFGYVVEEVQPVDLFGQGWHVEVVVSICRKNT